MTYDRACRKALFWIMNVKAIKILSLLATFIWSGKRWSAASHGKTVKADCSGCNLRYVFVGQYDSHSLVSYILVVRKQRWHRGPNLNDLSGMISSAWHKCMSNTNLLVKQQMIWAQPARHLPGPGPRLFQQQHLSHGTVALWQVDHPRWHFPIICPPLTTLFDCLWGKCTDI